MQNNYDVDELQLYLGSDYAVTDKITIHQPTIREIAEFGENKYYSAVFMLTCIPSDMKSQLEDLGFNYMEVPDYDLFLLLSRTLKQEDTALLFGDLDFSAMTIAKDDLNGDTVLVDVDKGIKIDKLVYIHITEFLRKAHGIKPKVEKAANETTRKIMIELDRQRIKKASTEKKHSQLKQFISGLMRNPACSLSLEEIKNLTIYQLIDTFSGIQVFTSTNALLIGSYSGMVDTKKIARSQFDWTRDISEIEESKIKLDAGAQALK